MQRGKYKCKQLKAVRKRIAEENGIPLEQKECTYEGPCRGTCPHCEAEVRYIEKALTERIRLGRVATVAGLSLGLAACGNGTGGNDTMLTTDTEPCEGKVVYPEDTLPPPPPPEDTAYLEETTMGIVITGDDGDVIPPPPPPPDDSLPILICPVQFEDDEEEGEVRSFVVVEQDPEFPGGMDSLYAFIQRTLRYPILAKDNGVSGKVYVNFVVEKDGSISNPRVLRDIGYGCGAEAIRVVKNMPRWNPGKQRGKPVRVQFNLPINFSLK